MTIAEQVQEIVEEMCKDYCKWPDVYDEGMEDCELSESSICKNCPLNRLSSVTPEERTGHWMLKHSTVIQGYYRECDQCLYLSKDWYNYCPECGAKMEE